MGTETAAEQAEHMRHPRPAADRLRAIFEGDEHAHADGALIASLAKSVLAERDRLRATLIAVRMIAVETVTDDADLLRQAILEHLGPDTAKAGA